MQISTQAFGGFLPRAILFSILAMVGASVFTAFCYQRWQLSQLEAPISGEISFASQQGFVEQVRKVRGVFHKGEASSIPLESIEECQSSHRSLLTEVEKLPIVFRESRGRAPADFPPSCLALMMKKSQPETKIKFSKCSSVTDSATEAERPCVTEPYLNAVYNLFGDMTACFGIPQKDFLPKIFFESSGHANALGSDGEAGLAQLSVPMIASANSQFDFYKKQVIASSEESCQRLAPLLQNLQALDAKSFTACEAMPLPLNLFYLAIRYEQNFEAVEAAVEKMNIESLMHKAGIERYEKEQLQHILVSLGSNAGPISAVIYLRDYLQLRISLVERKKAQPLTLADFDFRPPLKLKTQPEEMSFPAYLAVYQNTGTPAYLNFVTAAARILNLNLKEGTCVSESFLSLSL